MISPTFGAGNRKLILSPVTEVFLDPGDPKLGAGLGFGAKGLAALGRKKH